MERKNCRYGFSLLELLVVMAIVALLSSLGFTNWAKSKKKARAVVCGGLLRQIGTGLQMYVHDHQFYPALLDYSSNICFDAIFPYYPVHWTNEAWNCPEYITQRGVLSQESIFHGSTGIAYAYNYIGIASFTGRPDLRLGLGFRPEDCRKATEILVPSEMYAAADARCKRTNGFMGGVIKMHPFRSVGQIPPFHQQGYNVLFCDGHVSSVKWSDFVNPLKTAANWNFDNQPHADAWPDRSEWTE